MQTAELSLLERLDGITSLLLFDENARFPIFDVDNGAHLKKKHN